MSTAAELAIEALRATPSVYAEQVRRIRDRETGRIVPYGFRGRPFLIEPHDCGASRVVIMKGSQIGATELALNIAIHSIGIGRDVLTVLPLDEQIRTFVQARVDPLFEMSPALSGLSIAASNPKHKRIERNNWYFRGSNSEAGLLEIPVSTLILDEVDRLNPQAIPLARERLTGIAVEFRREVAISTPTFAGHGIDAMFRASSRGRWIVDCPACGADQPILWGKNLDPDREPPAWRCAKCRGTWSEDERRNMIEAGRWRHDDPGNPVRGFAVSQLYSPNETAESLVRAYLDAKENDDPTALRTFWNSKLGEPWAGGHKQLTRGEIRSAKDRDPYLMTAMSSGRISMGVDQGPKFLHVSLSSWPDSGTGSRCRRVIACYMVTEFDDLDEILTRHGVSCCVIDALPENRAAKDFQARHPDVVWLAYYPDRMMELCQWVDWADSDAGPSGPFGMRGGFVRINRTEALDRVFARFRNGSILLPRDLPTEPQSVSRHLMNLIVEEKTDQNGVITRRYTAKRKPDHFAHAMVYDEIAGLQVSSIEPAEIPEDNTGGELAPAGFNESFYTFDGGLG